MKVKQFDTEGNFYDSSQEGGVSFSDPGLCIDWHYPEIELILSEKDSALGSLVSLGDGL